MTKMPTYQDFAAVYGDGSNPQHELNSRLKSAAHYCFEWTEFIKRRPESGLSDWDSDGRDLCDHLTAVTKCLEDSIAALAVRGDA